MPYEIFRDFIYLSALSLAFPWLLWRRLRTGRYRTGVKQKLFGYADTRNSHGSARSLVWLHGVSVGEVQLLKPLIDGWRAERPELRFALSTTTESGMELARKIVPAEVLLFYFPLDFSWAVRRTLNSLQPKLLVLGELELWPNLIDLAARMHVPIAVVNGRLSPRSQAGYRRFGWLTRGMFAKIDLVAAQSESNAERFRDCGASRNTITTGSLKFDNVAFDRDCPEVSNLRALVGIEPRHRVWVTGSTQSPEEISVAKAFKNLQPRFPDLKLIVVPRHPDRFEAVFRELSNLGVMLLRRSTLHANCKSENWNVLLVDTIGELKWWWGLAEIAIVGGSFGVRGGQNMLEPAAYGANVAFGPNTANFRDIVDLLLSGEAAVRLESLEQIEAWVEAQLLEPQLGQARGARASNIVANQQGALARTIAALNALLDK